MRPDTSNALCRTLYRLVITVCLGVDVSWLYAHGREILWGRRRNAKAKFDSTGGISSYQGRRFGECHVYHKMDIVS
jgi:hypothetical protein